MKTLFYKMIETCENYESLIYLYIYNNKIHKSIFFARMQPLNINKEGFRSSQKSVLIEIEMH